jgi:hypothetical protein
MTKRSPHQHRHMAARAIKRASLAACVLVCVVAPTASGKTRYLIPPGDSAISQYTEVVPAGGGSTPAGQIPSAPLGTLPPAAALSLRGSGAAGSHLSKFVGATAPRVSHSPSRSSTPTVGGPSALGSLLHSVGGSGGGMGLILPLILLACLLAAAAATWQRHARS